jgi:hypothetical protein
MALIDSYPESNSDSNATNLTTVNSGHGQVITIGPNNVNLESVQFYIHRAASSLSDFTVKARIYAATGTVGTNAVGTGSAIAESTTTIAGSSITYLTANLFTFDFSNVVLQANTSYVLLLALASRTDGSPVVRYDNSSPTHYGNRVYFSSSAWTAYAD